MFICNSYVIPVRIKYIRNRLHNRIQVFFGRNRKNTGIKMKFVLCLLVLLPLVYCASIEDKRFIFGDFQISLDDLVAQLKGVLGADATEAACESECNKIAGTAGLLLCSPACHAVQSAAQG